jgi:hypothetical protein
MAARSQCSRSVSLVLIQEEIKADHSFFYAGDGSSWSVPSPAKSFWKEILVLVPVLGRQDFEIANVRLCLLERSEYVPTFSAQGLSRAGKVMSYK